MPWVFVIGSARLYGPSGTFFASAYSGNGPDKDNVASQGLVGHGPMPVGGYTMETPLEGTHLGPCAIPLLPDPTNVMFGRGDFYIHDDNPHNLGNASDGCLVTEGATSRRTIWASPDHRLEVVAEEADRPQPSA